MEGAACTMAPSSGSRPVPRRVDTVQLRRPCFAACSPRSAPFPFPCLLPDLDAGQPCPLGLAWPQGVPSASDPCSGRLGVSRWVLINPSSPCGKSFPAWSISSSVKWGQPRAPGLASDDCPCSCPWELSDARGHHIQAGFLQLGHPPPSPRVLEL